MDSGYLSFSGHSIRIKEHLNNVANSPMEPEDDASYGKIAGISRERHGKSGFQVVPDARSAPYSTLSVHLPTSIPRASCAGLADDSWTAPNLPMHTTPADDSCFSTSLYSAPCGSRTVLSLPRTHAPRGLALWICGGCSHARHR